MIRDAVAAALMTAPPEKGRHRLGTDVRTDVSQLYGAGLSLAGYLNFESFELEAVGEQIPVMTRTKSVRQSPPRALGRGIATLRFEFQGLATQAI
jgi:hypothetical protein